MVVPHANEFLDLLILLGWNVYRSVSMVSQTLCNERCITLICFDRIFPGFHHGSGSQNDTLDVKLCELVIQRKAQAAGFIAAYKINVVSGDFPQRSQIFEDLIIVGLHFLSCKHPILLHIVTAKCKSFFVDIHSDEKCVIIHL